MDYLSGEVIMKNTRGDMIIEIDFKTDSIAKQASELVFRMDTFRLHKLTDATYKIENVDYVKSRHAK
jgi:hypothetical protein